ncbi:MAG: MoaD/ThiS family protein [Burkholderiaceae bacterium]|nr:MoaD/ThiS family protein [Burkholderiaceae bacterium]MCD8536693.1 MoaD/ThiS family protein [Burkholderiaceae bacterium]
MPDTNADQARPVKVTLTGAFEPYTRGEETFKLAVSTVRGLLREIDRRYPGLAAVLEEDSAIAIDGVVHEIVYTQPLAPGAEVYFIPRLESG